MPLHHLMKGTHMIRIIPSLAALVLAYWIFQILRALLLGWPS